MYIRIVAVYHNITLLDRENETQKTVLSLLLPRVYFFVSIRNKQKVPLHESFVQTYLSSIGIQGSIYYTIIDIT